VPCVLGLGRPSNDDLAVRLEGRGKADVETAVADGGDDLSLGGAAAEGGVQAAVGVVTDDGEASATAVIACLANGDHLSVRLDEYVEGLVSKRAQVCYYNPAAAE